MSAAAKVLFVPDVSRMISPESVMPMAVPLKVSSS
jgi:hypothetical protein